MTECPVCKTNNPSSETWCLECGWLLSQTNPETAVSDQPALESILDFRVNIILPEKGMIPLRKARTVIGREFGDILITDDLNVSRIHFALIAEKGGMYLEDLRSSNGTLLNGVKIPAGRRYLLSSGDVITAGDSAIKIEFKGGPGDEEQRAGIYLRDANNNMIRIRQGDNTVGRLPLNTITIESSPYVAREHAVLSLEKTPSGLFFLYLTDLGSSNGSFINNKPVPAHTRIRLHPNDEISFADVTYRIIEITGED